MSKGAVTLIVVDMQVGLDDPQYGERCNPNCEVNVRTLLHAWRKAGQPAFFTRHISLRHGSPLARGSAGTSIKPNVAPAEGEAIFDKSVNSALKNPCLRDAIFSIHPRAVVVVGMATDACVTATAREAKDFGYATVVVGEACATFDRLSPVGGFYSAAAVHDVALAALAASGIQICPLSEAVGLVER
ncbi:MAG: isochorismatase family protein [Rhodoferax sp.]|nr:isochorismatase family protein [Rhodoferax sp.]